MKTAFKILALALALISAPTWGQSLVQKTLSTSGTVVVSLANINASALTVQATGGATFASTFQVSDDQSTWITITGNALPSGTVTSTAAADGYWTFNVSGHRFFRVNLASITGTENFTTFATPGNSNAGPGNSANPGSVVLTPSGSAAFGLAPISSTANEASHVLKSSAGNLYGVTVVPTVAGYLMVFDATNAPADGAVTPKFCIPVAAGVPGNVTSRGIPASFATGIVAVFSTTGCFTKTASATAMFIGTVN